MHIYKYILNNSKKIKLSFNYYFFYYFFTIVQLNRSIVYNIEHFISEGNSFIVYINIYIYIYIYTYISIAIKIYVKIPSLLPSILGRSTVSTKPMII